MGKDKDKGAKTHSTPASSSATTTTSSSGGMFGSVIATHLALGSPLSASSQVIVKSLLKPSPVTKAKALAELLSVIVSTSTAPEECSGLVSCWAEVLPRLMAEPDREVRAGACAVLVAMTTSAGQDARRAFSGAVVRAVIPSWLYAAADPAREVSERALEAMRAVPRSKLCAVVRTCRVEVAEFCASSLLRALHDVKASAGQQNSEAGDRACCSSLGAVRVACEIFDECEDAQALVLELVQKVLPSDKAWKMCVQSPSAACRRAAYLLISRLVSLPNSSRALVDWMWSAQLNHLVMAALGEKAEPLRPVMLETVLSWIKASDGVRGTGACWTDQTLSLRKAVFPKLFSLLREPCCGGPDSSPCVLPLISTLPAEVLGPGTEFLAELFGALFCGLTSSRPLDRQSACRCYCETAMFSLERAGTAGNAAAVAFLCSPVIESAILAALIDGGVATDATAASAVATELSRMPQTSPAWVVISRSLFRCCDSVLGTELPQSLHALFELSPVHKASLSVVEAFVASLKSRELSRKVVSYALARSLKLLRADLVPLVSRLLDSCQGESPLDTAFDAALSEEALLAWLRERCAAGLDGLVKCVVGALTASLATSSNRDGVWKELVVLTSSRGGLLVEAVRRAAKWHSPSSSFDDVIVPFVSARLREVGAAVQPERRAAVDMLSVVTGFNDPQKRCLVSLSALSQIAALLSSALEPLISHVPAASEDGSSQELQFLVAVMDAARRVLPHAVAGSGEGFCALLRTVFQLRVSSDHDLSAHAETVWSETATEFKASCSEQLTSAFVSYLSRQDDEAFSHSASALSSQLDALISAQTNLADSSLSSALSSAFSASIDRLLASCQPYMTFSSGVVSPLPTLPPTPPKKSTLLADSANYLTLCRVWRSVFAAPGASDSTRMSIAGSLSCAHAFGQLCGSLLPESFDVEVASTWNEVVVPFLNAHHEDCASLWRDSLALAKERGGIYAALLEFLPVSDSVVSESALSLLSSSESVAAQFTDKSLAALQAVLSRVTPSASSPACLSALASLKQRLLADFAEGAAAAATVEVRRRTLCILASLPEPVSASEFSLVSRATTSSFADPCCCYELLRMATKSRSSGIDELLGTTVRIPLTPTPAGIAAAAAAFALVSKSAAPATVAAEVSVAISAAPAVLSKCTWLGTADSEGLVASLLAAAEAVTKSEWPSPNALVGADTEAGLWCALDGVREGLQRAAYVVLACHYRSLARAPVASSPAPSDEDQEGLPLAPAALTPLLCERLSRPGQNALSDLLSWSVLFTVVETLPFESSQACAARVQALMCDQFQRMLVTATRLSNKEAPKSGPIPLKAPLSTLGTWVFFKSLESVPGLVRAVAKTSSLERRDLILLQDCARLAAHLVAWREFSKAESRRDSAIQCSRGTSSIIVSFDKEDVELEATITLPKTYPLDVAEVSGSKRTGGVKEGLWRRWLLGLECLVRSSPSVVDACAQWRKAMDHQFEGVDCCPICMSVFSAGGEGTGPGGQLPTMRCRTCRKSFHSSCMAQWFQTSHKTSCPLCHTDLAFRVPRT